MKKITVDGLRKKAWDTFSVYIRLRDRRCVSCDEKFWDTEKGEYGIKGLQAGHFRHHKLDFDEENINAQCERCNHYLSGNLAPYSVYLVNKLGTEGFIALNSRADHALSGEKLSREDCEAIITKYKKKSQEILQKFSLI